MNHSFLKSERVFLRALEPEDLEILYTMENDSETWDVSNFTVPYSHYLLKQYIADNQADIFADRQLRLIIAQVGTGTVLGTIDVTDFSPIHARGDVGISLLRCYRGQGYAIEALRLLCEYFFRFLNLRQLTAHVAADNTSSLKLFQTCGFRPCGLLKEWWRVENEYRDVVVLQLLSADTKK
ncbi:MAG: GNAT family N-acetyltransferase [Bacteroides sp.]|nr:GNAT family N-acetyltransferase [Bacteroides sp.]